MTATFDREQHLLDRLTREIPDFAERLQACQVSVADLEAHRQVVIDSLELIDQGRAPELATMREQLAYYGLELACLQLDVAEAERRVESMLN